MRDIPFIVGVHFAFQTEEQLFLVLDFVPGGELFFHLKEHGRFAEKAVRTRPPPPLLVDLLLCEQPTSRLLSLSNTQHAHHILR